MKKIFLAFAVFSSISIRVYAQWVEVTPPFVGTHYTSDLSVVSSQVAFILSKPYVTDSFILSRTIDGGSTWEFKSLPPWPDTVGWPNGMQFSSPEIGYIYGYSNINLSYVGAWMFKTIDGGDNWSKVSLPDSPIYQITLLHFFDSERGVLIPNSNSSGSYTVFSTSDGGLTWTEHSPIDRVISNSQFQSDGSGVGFAKYSHPNRPRIFTTTDFGISWTLLDTAEVTANWATYRQFMWFQGSYFINDTVGYSFYEESTGPYTPKFYHWTKTADGGTTWTGDGLIWYASLFQGKFEVKDESLWILTDKYLFRNVNSSSGVKVADNLNSQLTIMPNPLQSGYNLQLNTNNNFSGEADIQILHTNGLMAHQTTLEVFEGQGELPIGNLPSGIYFITVKPENQELPITGKLIVH